MKHISSILVFTIVASSGIAAADAKAKAESLFRQGRELMAGGRYAEACAAFDSSQKYDPSTATLFNQADCREKNGQLATAWGLFVEAERQTRVASETGKKLHETAIDRAARLEARLSKVTVSVPAPVDGLVIERGAVPIEQGEWNRALPVDGGTYTFSARIANREVWKGSVAVGNEADQRIVVVVLAAAQPMPEQPRVEKTIEVAPAASDPDALRIGARFGFTSATQAGNVTLERRGGITIGGFAALQLSPRVSLEGGVGYTQKGGGFDDGSTYELDYLEAPIVGVYTLPLSPSRRLRVFGGANLDLLVSAGGLGDVTKTFDVGLSLGAGLSTDVGKHTLVFDARYELGLTNTSTLIFSDGTEARLMHRVLSFTGGYVF